MYGWIWRHLPFGLPGKIIGSVLLAAGMVLVLWYGVFPAAEPLLPFGDVQVSNSGAAGNAVTPTVSPHPTASLHPS